MTQLDRLEALLKTWQEGKRYYGAQTVEQILPDLIRVARAAKRIRDGNPGGVWNEGEECQEFYSVIDESPLYREVEQ